MTGIPACYDVASGFEGLAVNEFALKAGEETLRHGITNASPNIPMEWPHTHLAAAIAEGHAGVLAPLVAMMNNLLGVALLQSHIQCSQHQASAHLLINSLNRSRKRGNSNSKGLLLGTVGDAFENAMA